MSRSNTARSTAQWRRADAAHHLHPFTDTKELNRKGARVITRADGVYLWDSEGNRILDGMAGLWCVNVGYGRREIADAVHEQMLELPYYNTFFQTSHPPVIELASMLAELTPPGLSHVFLTNSGSEANDTVIRLARHYWTSMGRPRKQVIVSRHNAYHGSTVGAASLGGMAPMHAQGGLPIPDVAHIEEPYWFEHGGDSDPEVFGQRTARALERYIDRVGAGRVAAFIGEPIQGAGGVVIPPDSYWPEIQRICREHDVLLVADEVICGFGRTGEWFGSDLYGLSPDLMPIAKGLSSGYLPIGGVMVSDRVADGLISSGGEFAHGFTYSAHPVTCTAAVTNLRILRDEGLVERAGREIGPYLHKRWRELGDHPLVGEARAVGMLGALELVRDKSTRERHAPVGRAGTTCRDAAIDRGLVMRAVRDTMIISPPLSITTGQIDELVEKAWEALDLAWKRL